MLIEEKRKLLRSKAEKLALSFYLSKGSIPIKLYEILANTSSLEALQKYSPDQPRVPAGDPDGGQWTDGGGSGGGGAGNASPSSNSPQRKPKPRSPSAPKKPASSINTSRSGSDFIARREGFRGSVYRDSAGIPTIGYGHRLKPGEKFPNGISKREALDLLRQDTRSAENAVKKGVKVGLAQHQFDALSSFVYNVGGGAFRGSTLLNLLNRGEYDKAAGQFMRWNKINKNGKYVVSEGLTERRRYERDLFLYGKYD